MEAEAMSSTKRELRALESAVNRLEHYVSLLDENKAAVIRVLYFEHKTWDDAAHELHISRQTLSRYRNGAIGDLTLMYSAIKDTAEC